MTYKILSPYTYTIKKEIIQLNMLSGNVKKEVPMQSIKWLSLLSLTVLLCLLCGCAGVGSSTHFSQSLPNMNQTITPLAPQGSVFQTLNPDLPGMPDWLAGQAVTTVVSPDKKTLLVLTSGYNRIYTSTPSTPYPWYTPYSYEYVFVYDISANTPVKKQVVKIPNTYHGIVFDPSGKAFYVAGGVNDNVHVFTKIADGIWGEAGKPLALGHKEGVGIPGSGDSSQGVNLQVGVKPCAAGVTISNDGKTLVVANYYNDSISVFKGGLNNWKLVTQNLDLRPGKSGGASGEPGGEYPFWVVVKGNEKDGTATAYVSSIRDREIVAVNLNGTPSVMTPRIKAKGQPNKITLNRDQTLLYVAEDLTDTIDIIDTSVNKVVGTIPVIAPEAVMPDVANYTDENSNNVELTGANSNSVTLSPDEKQLYVTNGNLNCVAVVNLNDAKTGGQVVALIPTGWYPNSVSFSGDGNWVYVINGKSPTGPNPNFRYTYGPPTHSTGIYSNQYNPQLTKAGLQSFPRPNTAQLTTLTSQVALNNRFSYTDSSNDMSIMAAVRAQVKHVIFVIKENRTYDQILGDLEVGNGDPELAEFGKAYTPSQHQLARQFVTLDNFYASSEGSMEGWPWTVMARAPDVIEHHHPVLYAGRGLSLDSEGLNRSVNVALPNDGYPGVTRQNANPLTPDDPDLLPGHADIAAADGPNSGEKEVGKGYVWDAAIRKGLTVRNYGFFMDSTLYAQGNIYSIPLDRDPFSSGRVVAYATNVALAPFTDQFFRGFDNSFPDYYRFKEWEREFDNYEKAGAELPVFSLVRFMHDHTGNYDTAIDGVNTPEIQQADNDYATGLLVEKISKSPRYKDNTLIFIIEDDSQDGGDHVDSHRTVTFVAGAFVKQGKVISTHYNTVNFLRTIEEVLGLPPMNLNDALARPMADIFNTTPSSWSFTAIPAPILNGTTLPPFLDKNKSARLNAPKPTHDAEYWAQVTKGMDFTTEDTFDFATYNHILWKGLMGDKPYPIERSGKDLRQNRKELLERYN
ncbi:MAG: beta-propeller fold lactonase family protein [Thermodesulfobacteriota bacterium]